MSFRFRIRPRLGRRTRLNLTNRGSVGVSRSGRRMFGSVSNRGASVGGRSRRGLFDWIFRL